MTVFMELKKLPQNYKTNGLSFDLVDRTDKSAIYVSDVGTYEVHQIEVADAQVVKFGDKISDLPKREVLPSNEKFGSISWSFQTESSARAKFNELNLM